MARLDSTSGSVAQKNILKRIGKMASPNIIDLQSILTPFVDPYPTGIDLRQDSSPTSYYQQVKIARAAARAAERNSIYDGETNEADEQWRKIVSLAPTILATQSKDLEVLSWLAEALLRRHGFQGLRDTFKVLEGFLENFWDNLYPMPDEDGMETRTSPITGLNGEGAEGVLIAPIRKVPITEGFSPGPFSFWQYQQALDAQRATSDDVRESKIQKLGFSLDDIEKAVNDSSTEFFVDQLDDINEVIAAYKNVSRILDERCGYDAPPTRNIIEVLEECRGAILHIGKLKFPTPVVEEIVAEVQVEDSSGVTKPATNGTTLQGAVNSREVAFKQLQEIAKFFRKTEPHSPISYLIEKAVKWGNMSLDELIIELIPEASSRTKYSELTGVPEEDK